MKAHAPKPKQPQTEASPHPSRLTRHTTWNQALTESPQTSAEGLKAGPGASAPTGFAHDFSRIPVSPGAPVRLRAKLTVNTPGDTYEQEADRVAEQVTHAPEPQLKRACACAGDCSKCQAAPPARVQRLVRTKGVQANTAEAIAPPAVVDEVLRTPGQPLDAGVRAFMEPRFGQDFGRVRVHADRVAGSSAESIGARAYTVGHHVVFGAGEYRPGTPDGRRLLAHELTHVAQQDARPSPAGAVVQRDAKAPAKNTAAGGPKLDFRPAKNPPPCACIVFIHHNEPNARLTAQLMYEFCHYNLAIVDPQTSAREIKLPGKGVIDPNELFPRKVAEECWDDDKPCEDFLSNNAGATTSAVVEEYAQRQFFLAVKKCSDGFTLPVVGLHNNTIEDTARYRQAVRNKAKPLDLTPIRGKTFDDALKAGEKSAEADTLPFVDLQEWLLKNAPGVTKKRVPTGNKGKLETPTAPKEANILTAGKTNIFLWCSAEDISRCQIGDPERPDNVVWVTNAEDFRKLQGTKTNVVLQTRVDPKGRSATDLSSLFVFLGEIVGAHFSGIISKLASDAAVDITAIVDAIAALRKLPEKGSPAPDSESDELAKIIMRAIVLLLRLQLLSAASETRTVKLSQLRFINIETPQSPSDATTKPADLRVQSYRDVKATLAAVGLDCCEAEGAVGNIEKALREGKLPKAEAK